MSRFSAKKRIKFIKTKIALALLALVLFAGCVISAGFALGVSRSNIDWYLDDTSAEVFEIDTSGEFVGFIQLVNGTYDGNHNGKMDYKAVSFKGKTIRLTSDLGGLSMWLAVHMDKSIQPIGTKKHPFQGTFEGFDSATNHKALRSILFAIEADESKSAISNFGLFGYVGKYGTVSYISAIGGSLISINNTQHDALKVSNVGGLVGTCKGTIQNCECEAQVVVSSGKNDSDEDACYASARNIGGLVGSCTGKVKNSSFSGELSVSVAVKSTSTKTNYRVCNIGGVAGKLYGDMNACINNGKVQVDANGQGVWNKRTDEWVFPCTKAVGGLAGVVKGTLSNSINNAKISCANKVNTSLKSDHALYSGAIGAGGVCGILVKGDKESGVYDCTNNATVVGYRQVGGICGLAQTQNAIEGCVNRGEIDAYRWDRALCGGLVGDCSAQVSYSYNTGSVASYEGGSVVAGLAGRLNAGKNSVVTACYNTGYVSITNPGEYTLIAGLVAQNNGLVHGNVLAQGTCTDDVLAGNTELDRGLWGVNTLVSTGQINTKKAVALLNAVSAQNGWERYYVHASSVGGNFKEKSPQLNTRVDMSDATDLVLAQASATCKSDASYTGRAAVPEVELDCKGDALVQNVDFRVEPQKGATKLSDGEQPYQAKVIGMGAYKGTLSEKVAYGIKACDLSTCTVLAKSNVFNWKNQPLKKRNVVVLDATGAKLSSSMYSISVQGDSNGKTINHTSSGYSVTVESAIGYRDRVEGKATGVYCIQQADLQTECTISGVRYKGQVYAWDSSSNYWKSKDEPQLKVGDDDEKPRVTSVYYKGKRLKEGRDYKVVYNIPVTGEACIVVKPAAYGLLGSCNFTGEVTLYFHIVRE